MKLTTVSLLKFLFGIVLFVGVAVGAFLFIGWPSKTKGTIYGVTFSRPYAEELKLDPDRVLTVALDEVGVRRFRIPAYWGLLETKPDTWDFTQLDKDIDAIGQRNGKVILAVGEKLPRWPECWGPDWWKKMPAAEQHAPLMKYIETVVTRYRNNPAIQGWQIENEPHFQYGDCPSIDLNALKQEVNFVRGLDPSRPITTTDSGELSAWTTFDGLIDSLGVSVYRVVRNPLFGSWNVCYWFVPPYLYERKALLAKWVAGVKDVYVSEFQMEPWSNKSLEQTPISDQMSSMSPQQMTSNFSFAERMGMPSVDFWGIEWWEWMRETQGHPEYIDIAKAFWKTHQP